MVYHRRSLNALYSAIRGGVSGKFARGMSLAQVLNHYSDGATARYYTRVEFARMLAQKGFSHVSTQVLGLKSELVPLPPKGSFRKVKDLLVTALPDVAARPALGLVGGFLFARARKSPQSSGNAR